MYGTGEGWSSCPAKHCEINPSLRFSHENLYNTSYNCVLLISQRYLIFGVLLATALPEGEAGQVPKISSSAGSPRPRIMPHFVNHRASTSMTITLRKDIMTGINNWESLCEVASPDTAININKMGRRKIFLPICLTQIIPARPTLHPVMKWKSFNIAKTWSIFNRHDLFSHITVHIPLIILQKVQMGISNNTALPTCPFQNQIRPYMGLERALFAVTPSTIKSIDGLDFYTRHCMTPHDCMLKKITSITLKLCSVLPASLHRCSAAPVLCQLRASWAGSGH